VGVQLQNPHIVDPENPEGSLIMRAQIRNAFNRLRRSFCEPVLPKLLAGPFGRTADEKLDAALADFKADRIDLFTKLSWRVSHRKRMVRMMNRIGVPIDYTIEQSWSEIKSADHRCAHCADAKRCDLWLASDFDCDRPQYFCPNAELFARLKSEAATAN